MTFFFYDTETTGVNTFASRIMQFGGQRTDMDLNPIGEPVNILIKLTDDILPDPYATLIHGITPQKTLAEGVSEPEFLELLKEEVFKPDTIMVGYNNIRFDDEFLRYSLWRNFYDPYEWAYKDGRSRWDLLDVVRMTHALRPEGLRWPNIDGKPSHKLEAMAHANNIDASSAHDALADVMTTLELARLIKTAQPKLFDWLLKLRDKNEVSKLVSLKSPKPFLYSSGRYPSEYLHTTAAVAIAAHPSDSNGVLVYDLRQNPEDYKDLNDEQLRTVLFGKREERILPSPLKKLALNRSPAIAPLATLDDGAQRRLKLRPGKISKNLKALKADKDFQKQLAETFLAREPYPPKTEAENQLYEGGFLGPKDKKAISEITGKTLAQLMELTPNFIDERLNDLFIRYKARHFPQALSSHEREVWDKWRSEKLLKGGDGSLSLTAFAASLQKLADQPGWTDQQKFLLEELDLYAQSIVPQELIDQDL